MFSALALFFVLVAGALSHLAKKPTGIRWVRAFWILNVILVVPITLSDGNRSMAAPLREVGERGDIRTVVAVGRFVAPRIYVNRKADVRTMLPAQLDAPSLGALESPGTIRFIFNRPPTRAQHRMLEDAGFHCASSRSFPGDLLDRFVVWLNPEGNRRRLPRVVLDCRDS